MASGTRSRLRPEQRRDQLLALGMEMLSTRPLEEVTIDEIAAAANISKGLLFHYFSSKREFHLEVARVAATELLECTAPEPDLPPIERLTNSIERFVDYVMANDKAYIALVSGGTRVDGDLAELFNATRRTNADRLVDALIELGATDLPLLHVAARAWVAFVEEATVDALTRGDIGRDTLVQFLQSASLPVISVAIEDPVALDALMARLSA